jgi:hypothetical protein
MNIGELVVEPIHDDVMKAAPTAFRGTTDEMWAPHRQFLDAAEPGEAVPESAAWNYQREHSSPKSGAMRDAMMMATGSPGVYRRI